MAPVARGQRAEVRMGLAQGAGRDWLAGQGARAGFAVVQADVTAYRVLEPP